jgi:hypothetical protein
LNSSTGELCLAADIDREIVCPLSRRVECRFQLKIFELFTETLYHVPIIIDDINDHWPRFPYRSSQIDLHLSEHSLPYQTKLFIQRAYDQDHEPHHLHYRLTSSSDVYLPFRLQVNSDQSDRLALILIDVLDREDRDIYQCTLYVIDTAGHEEQLHVRIHVDDVNDHSPV